MLKHIHNIVQQIGKQLHCKQASGIPLRLVCNTKMFQCLLAAQEHIRYTIGTECSSGCDMCVDIRCNSYGVVVAFTVPPYQKYWIECIILNQTLLFQKFN